MDLKQVKALVTGGASGLGESTVRAIVEAGGKAGIVDMDKDRAAQLAAELSPSVAFAVADVTSEQDIDRAVVELKQALGGLNAVVNCAGIGGSVKIMGKEGLMSMERFNRWLQINLAGTFNVIRGTLETLTENEPNEEGERGVYVNTASIAAFDGQVGQAGYSSSKGGVVSMTLTLAREFAMNGIRVMAILPGIMNTPMLGRLPDHVRARLGEQVPFPPRLGNPAEFGKLARHIIENPYLNGEFIRLDGALRMGWARK